MPIKKNHLSNLKQKYVLSKSSKYCFRINIFSLTSLLTATNPLSMVNSRAGGMWLHLKNILFSWYAYILHFQSYGSSYKFLYCLTCPRYLFKRGQNLWIKLGYTLRGRKPLASEVKWCNCNFAFFEKKKQPDFLVSRNNWQAKCLCDRLEWWQFQRRNIP